MHLNVRCPPLSIAHEKTMHIYVNMPLLMTLSLLTRSFLLTLSGKLLILQSPFFCGNHLQHSQAETTTPFSVLPLHFSCDMASCGMSHWTTVTCSFVSPAQQSMFKKVNLFTFISSQFNKWLWEGERKERRAGKRMFSEQESWGPADIFQ